ncbi:MAG: RusA family crossover junction endodeoxyribonuclease [Liquorilactobacillus ghanensis]|uniref:RusA family crossover junction endodeoxyribonuclease n=1 Tax=Liquorilactobacillus ghanensis TaxID=399370 RepID=UPI0039E8BFE3
MKNKPGTHFGQKVVIDGYKKYKFVFNIEPVPQGRPRFSRWGTYDPPKSKEFKKTLSFLARSQFKKEPISAPINISLVFYRRIQKNSSKRTRGLKNKGVIRPVVKGDLDNYIKGTLDALNGIVWVDDNRIVGIKAEKYYSDQPRIEAQIEVLK